MSGRMMALALLSLSLAGLAAAASYHIPTHLDGFVCNNGTAFACHCATASDEALRRLPTCYALIQGRNLSVIRLRATELSLSEVLPPKEEDYESYFKRKLASVLSRHCRANAQRCPGLGLDIRPDSVVVLKVRCVGGGSNETELLLTILRSKEETHLNSTTAMSAWTLLDVLRAEKATLNRVFGPATITELRILTLSFQQPKTFWRKVYDQNRDLIIGLIVAAAILIIIYIIAVGKVIWDRCCAGGGGSGRKEEEEEALGLSAVTAKAKRQDGAFRRPSGKVQSYGATQPPPPLRRPSELISGHSIDGMAVRPPSSTPRNSPSQASLPRSRSSHSPSSSQPSLLDAAKSPPQQTVVEVQACGEAVRRPAPPPPPPVQKRQSSDEPPSPPPPPPPPPEISPESTPPPTPEEEPYIAPYDEPTSLPSASLPQSPSPEQLNLALAAPIPNQNGGDTSAYEETSDTDSGGGLPQPPSSSSYQPAPSTSPPLPPQTPPTAPVQILVDSPLESPRSQLSPCEEPTTPQPLPHSSDEEPLHEATTPTPATAPSKVSPLPVKVVNGGSSAEDIPSSDEEDSGSELPGNMDYHRLRESNWSINRDESDGLPHFQLPPGAGYKMLNSDSGEPAQPPPPPPSAPQNDQEYHSSSPDLR